MTFAVCITFKVDTIEAFYVIAIGQEYKEMDSIFTDA